VNVDVELPENLPPIADAGADSSVDEGAGVMLSAAGSSDPENGALTYAWTQTAGPAVVLSDADTATPSFTAPQVDADTPLTFELTVTDDLGATATDTVTVTVRDLNLPPVANAGADFSVDEGQSALLSGAGSSDPDGDALSYAWTQTAGPPVVLDGADTAAASFTAPDVSMDTALTFELEVTDIGGLSDTDEVVITVNDVPDPDTDGATPDDLGNNSVGSLPPVTLLALGLLALARRRAGRQGVPQPRPRRFR